MSPLVKRYRDVAIVAVLLAVPFFFLRANMKKPENLNAMDRTILRISAPIEFGASSIARGIANLWDDYVYLVDVKQDNQKLSYENARLREQVHRLEHLQTKNQQLQRVLDLKEATPSDAVSAQVVGSDFNEFFRTSRVILDRRKAEILPNRPVISADGVVGKTSHAEGDSVSVILAADARFSVDVEDDRTKARGYLRGTSDPARYACRVENVDSRDEVEIGDLLVTSGKGKWFPHGIPVARVTKVLKRELGRDQEVEAVPTVDFSRLDTVLILTGAPRDEAPGPAPAASAATAPKGKR